MIKENKFLLHRLSDSIKIVSIFLICLLFTQDCFDFKSSKQIIVDKKNTPPGDETYFTEYDIKDKYSLDEDIIIEFKIGRTDYFSQPYKVYYKDVLNIYVSNEKEEKVLIYSDDNYSSDETTHNSERVYDGYDDFSFEYYFDYKVDLNIPSFIFENETGEIEIFLEFILEYDRLIRDREYPEYDSVKTQKVYYDGSFNLIYTKTGRDLFLKEK